MCLYGGAQYHRAMEEFRYVAGGTKCPPISCEEIFNACGVEDIHDGTNYFRTPLHNIEQKYYSTSSLLAKREMLSDSGYEMETIDPLKKKEEDEIDAS